MAKPFDRTSRRRHTGLAWLGALIPIAIIAAAAGAYFLFFPPSNDETADNPPTAPETLALGKDYYVVVKTIELYPTRPGGKAWDRLDDSGPDIRFELDWQDNTVFKGDTRSDTLIGSWEALSIDLKQAILNQKIDLGSAIDAAIIRIEQGTEVRLTVFDDDLTGSDLAGVVTLSLDKMKRGDNTREFGEYSDSAIKRLVVRLIDKSMPLRELVEEATRP